jgi:hypothetical protein
VLWTDGGLVPRGCARHGSPLSTFCGAAENGWGIVGGSLAATPWSAGTGLLQLPAWHGSPSPSPAATPAAGAGKHRYSGTAVQRYPQHSTAVLCCA